MPGCPPHSLHHERKHQYVGDREHESATQAPTIAGAMQDAAEVIELLLEP